MREMHEPKTRHTYDLWSRFYDATFGRLVHKRQLRAVAELHAKPGQRVLDLGVGTGMTLSAYPPGVMVVGMDLSPGMLNEAAKKVRAHQLTHCHLVQGDAMAPPFAAESFDHVILTHTVSVVSDPAKLMMWARRLVKPGGRVVILNHFQSAHRPVACIESLLNPLFIKLGWRSDLSLEACLAGAGLEVLYHYKLSLVDLWRIVVLTRHDEG